MGDVLTRKCRHGVLINEGFPFDDVSQDHTTPDTTVWIDLCRPSKSSTSGPPETTLRPHNPHLPVENRVPPVSQGEARRAGGRPTAIPGMAAAIEDAQAERLWLVRPTAAKRRR